MSIAEFFDKSQREADDAGCDRATARRQFNQSLGLIAATLALVGGLLFGAASDRDRRPTGSYAVSARQAERGAGHYPAPYGQLTPRIAPEIPSPPARIPDHSLPARSLIAVN